MFLSFAHRPKFVLIRKVVSSIMTFAFLTSLSSPAGAQLASLLPTPGSAVTISPVFVPPTLKGLNIHPENPFLFDFIVGRGDEKIQGEALKAESEKLVKFFLTAMTIPDKEAWVNLSPYEANRIIPDALGKTEMGKVMLEQDYLLKQLASSLTNPDTDLGKKFWTNVRAKAKEKFGTTDIPMSTFNKVWIVPSKAEVAEKDGKVFITQNRLKVMLEEDYQAMASRGALSTPSDVASSVAMQKTLDAGRSTLEKTTNVQPPTSSLSSEVFRSTILPSIEKEINEGKNFAAVRQIYDAAILAVWYKSALKESLLGKIYADKSKVKGIETDAVGFKEEVYKQYVEAFKKGAYNMIKEDFDMTKDESVPTRYFSGGMSTAYPAGVAVSSGVTESEANLSTDDVIVQVVGTEGPEAPVVAQAAAAQSAASAVEVKLDTTTIKTVFEGVRTNSNWKLQVIVNSGGTSLLEVVGKNREIFGDLPADLNINDESALRAWMLDKVVFYKLNELYSTHKQLLKNQSVEDTTIIITTYAQQIISSMQESFRGGKNIGTSFDTALSDLIVQVSRDVVQFRVKETLEGFQREFGQGKAVATYELIEQEYSKRILSMLEDAVESISDYSGITTRKDAFSHIYRGLNDEDKFFLSVAYVLLSQVRELQSQEDPMQEDEAIKKVLSEDGLLIATILQDGLISSEDHWNFAASSSALEAFVALETEITNIEGLSLPPEQTVDKVLKFMIEGPSKEHNNLVFRKLEAEFDLAEKYVTYLHENVADTNADIRRLVQALSNDNVYETLVSNIQNSTGDWSSRDDRESLGAVMEEVERPWKGQDLPAGSVKYMIIRTWLASETTRKNLEKVIVDLNKNKFGFMKALMENLIRAVSREDIAILFTTDDYKFYRYFRDSLSQSVNDVKKAIDQRATAESATKLSELMDEAKNVTIDNTHQAIASLAITLWINKSGDHLQHILAKAADHYEKQGKMWIFTKDLLAKIMKGEISTTVLLEFFLFTGGVANDVMGFVSAREELASEGITFSEEENTAISALKSARDSYANQAAGLLIEDQMRRTIVDWISSKNRNNLNIVLNKMAAVSQEIATNFQRLSEIPPAEQNEKKSMFDNSLAPLNKPYFFALTKIIATYSASSALEDNLDKYVMDLRAEGLSYEQMYRAFESRYNTNRRLLQDVANNFLFTKDEKTAAPLAADYKQAYEMALSQLSETDKLFLLFFKDVNRRVEALKAEGQNEVQAINSVLEKEVQRIENIQKIEQERLRAREERLAKLRKEIEDLIPEIEKKLNQVQTTTTASLAADADQSQKDAAILSEIQRQYDALKAPIEKRVRQINYAKDVKTTNILPGQALRRAISELSLQDQIRYQLFPELQKQMEKMTLSNPSANDKFERSLKAVKEVTIEKTLAASSALTQEQIEQFRLQAEAKLRDDLGFRLDQNPSMEDVVNRYREIAEGKSYPDSKQDYREAVVDIRMSEGLSDSDIYDSLVDRRIPEVMRVAGIKDSTFQEIEDILSAGKTALENGLGLDLIDPRPAGEQKSSSPLKPVGGINFDPTLMNLQVKRDKNGVPLPLPQQDLKNINIEGLYPVIINIAPATLANFPLLSKAEEEKQRIPSAKDDLSPIDRQKTLKDRVGKKV